MILRTQSIGRSSRWAACCTSAFYEGGHPIFITSLKANYALLQAHIDRKLEGKRCVLQGMYDLKCFHGSDRLRRHAMRPFWAKHVPEHTPALFANAHGDKGEHGANKDKSQPVSHNYTSFPTHSGEETESSDPRMSRPTQGDLKPKPRWAQVME